MNDRQDADRFAGAATADRAAWLVERLGLQAIGADVLAEVGLPTNRR
ncbi:MAG TPA: hypothetical protein VL687_08890 [Methylomirabilota bacterium]|nr:hypothetical protein [Methylomirabilota bacterium]